MQRILRTLALAVLVIGCITITGTSANAAACCKGSTCCTTLAGQCCATDATGCYTYSCKQAI